MHPLFPIPPTPGPRVSRLARSASCPRTALAPQRSRLPALTPPCGHPHAYVDARSRIRENALWCSPAAAHPVHSRVAPMLGSSRRSQCGHLAFSADLLRPVNFCTLTPFSMDLRPCSQRLTAHSSAPSRNLPLRPRLQSVGVPSPFPVECRIPPPGTPLPALPHHPPPPGPPC